MLTSRFKKILQIFYCTLTLFLLIISPVSSVYREFEVSQQVTGPVCNFNGVCEAGEDNSNCPNDCPSGGPGPIDTTPPVIYNLQISSITTNFATISWDTNEQALCQLFWGGTSAYEKGIISENAFYRTHLTNLKDLLPETIYHFKISCKDTAGNESETSGQKFSTLALPDTTPPANVRDFEAIPGDSQVELRWQNPPDIDFKGVRILRSEKFFPLDPWNGALIYEGTSESFVDTGLTNKVRYYYTAFTFDRAGNFSSGAIVSAIPRPAVPPEEAPVEILPPEIPEAPEIPPEIKDLLDELTLRDFEFWQNNKQLEIIKDKVTAKPEGPLTILLKYEKVPEVLKTIAITFLRIDGKTFSFLLRIDQDKTAFAATLIPPDPQEYGMKIQVLDYKNQRLKKIDGELEIEKLPEAPRAPIYIAFWQKYYIYICIALPLLLLLLLLLMLVYWLRKRQKKKEEKDRNL